MASPTAGILNEDRRSNWVRLHTLIVLRWIAVAGQTLTIFAARAYFDVSISIGLCLAVIGTSVVANLLLIFLYPRNTRMPEREVMWMLIFDLVQLAALLSLTGGLNNPFALLILAPVTISATALRTRATLMVGAVAIALATLVTWVHVPLQTSAGALMEMPPEFLFGYWVAVVIGVVFLGAYAQRVSSEVNSMSEALLATQMALAREQKISDLAGVVAAAAHELGTPLATIKLASSELIEDLRASPDLLDDAKLIRDQADRCRDILQSMGRVGKEDRQVMQAPLIAVVQEAAEPHIQRGKTVHFQSNPPEGDPKQPLILRGPEIVHGLRNLIQNAVDFAATTVWIDIGWTADHVSVRIIDDGQGFPPHIIDRIGDPFVRVRRNAADRAKRPGYDGMGLGLFIAKTLLERSGAELSFANGNDPFYGPAIVGERSGAIVEVIWPRGAIAAPAGPSLGLGENRPLDA